MQPANTQQAQPNMQAAKINQAGDFVYFEYSTTKMLVVEPEQTKVLWENIGEKPKKPSFDDILIGSNVRVPLTNKSEYAECYMEINQHFIYCKTKSSMKTVNYMDLINTRVEVRDGNIKGVPFYFLVFSKGKKYDNLIFKDKATRDRWISKLFKYCTFGQFDMFYKESTTLLGEGSYGQVRKCNRIGNENKFYAVKSYIKSKYLDNKVQIQLQRDEVNILRQLDHPNVMKIWGIFEDDKEVKIVSDCYYGGNLYKRLEKGSLDYRETLEVIRRILKGLAYLETKNIVHRDIKTQNIVFKYEDGSFDLAIVDFGFSLNWKNLKQSPPIYGTLGYFGPEILRLEPFDCRADVYSVGIIMFEM